ncbi:MAG: SMC-Scp complex subunit ScpB [Paracoccaceae bacterium]
MTEAEESGPAAALFDSPPLAELERMVEAILFASAEPLTRPQIEDRLPHGADASAALEALTKRYQGRGVQLARVGPAWAFRTASDLGFLMRREAQDTRKLSRAAIETLAIIAYHQPATRAEIEEIRGVSVSRGTLDLLLELDWIKLGRRRETPGRPVTFVTTGTFLDHFGLESARDLPGLQELRAAGLLDSRPPPGGGLDLEDEPDTADDDDSTEDMFAEEGEQQT